MTRTAPAARRVIAVDIDQPLPDLVADADHQEAMIVLWREGAPVGVTDVRLGDAEALRRAVDRIRAAAPVRPDPAGTSLPSISVVVPTIVGRIEDLDLLLRGLAAARYPGDAEIILVDNRRTVPEDDALPALVAGCGDPRVRVVRQPLPGISAARNAGVEAAVGEIVAFTDDDVRVDENWLRALGGRFAAQPELDAVTGLILPAELERLRRTGSNSTTGVSAASGPSSRSRSGRRDPRCGSSAALASRSSRPTAPSRGGSPSTASGRSGPVPAWPSAARG